jgi:lipopolysaccharide transport system ATP-binding protein
MDDFAIQVEHLSKRYEIGRSESFRTLRDDLVEAVYAPFRKIGEVVRQVPKGGGNVVWALKDVSFRVKRGEAIGIIGRNGAGKSTLLKILSRITEPTEGQARIVGRVGSLLEVGTGFHAELTGRENIYLNGAILGMRRLEIQRKFDEIVAFAEVEEFIDMPIKHYSTGMRMRLAFAVAAHLEPEILLVDEVLAVGDAAFQKKCVGKIGDVTKEGRTVLFVSHNMGAIVQLCPQSILLHSGSVELMGRSDEVVARYLAETSSMPGEVNLDPDASPLSPAVFTGFGIADGQGKSLNAVDVTKAFGLRLGILVRRKISGIDISIRFRNALGQPLFTTNLSDSTGDLATLMPGNHSYLIEMPPQFLAPDTYSLLVAIHRPGVELYDVQDGSFSFQVVESGSTMWQYHGQAYGNILVKFPWHKT